MRKVIVHADDFGLTAGVNRGIVKAYKEGILTSTSLMPGGEAFDDAVRLAKENSGLDLGIHLTLVGEKTVAPPQEVPSLVMEDGRFRQKYPDFLKDYLLKRIKMADIDRELSAQFDKVMKTGLVVSHIDGHQHLHMLPGILEIAVRLAKKYNVTGIRIPTEAFRFKQLFAAARWNRLVLQLGTNLVCQFAVKKVGLFPLKRAETFYGFFYSGWMTKENLTRTIEDLKGDVAEIMCHPGLEDPELKTRYAHWLYHWQKELEALTDPAVKELIQKKRIQLIGYRDLNSRGVVQ